MIHTHPHPACNGVTTSSQFMVYSGKHSDDVLERSYWSNSRQPPSLPLPQTASAEPPPSPEPAHGAETILCHLLSIWHSNMYATWRNVDQENPSQPVTRGSNLHQNLSVSIKQNHPQAKKLSFSLSPFASSFSSLLTSWRARLGCRSHD